MATTDKPVREQNLALRVMRLSRPKFNESICLNVDPADPFGVGIREAVQKTGQQSTEVPLGSFLMAPHAMSCLIFCIVYKLKHVFIGFSDVYLGETFAFYISIINISVCTCENINIKVDIQTQNQRIALSETAFSGIVLAPNQQVGQVFTHLIQEPGQHILVCAVSYAPKEVSSSEEAMSLRKFFKFPVSKPIEVITQRFFETQNGQTYFEVQIQNLCVSPITIDCVGIDADKQCEVEPIQPSTIRDHLDSDVILPQSIRQYLFRLTHLEAAGAASFRQLGPLTIQWRTLMGDRARIRVDTPPRVPPNFGDLRLTVERFPKRVSLHEVFSIVCKVQNYSGRPLDLTLSLEPTCGPNPPLVHCSVSGQHLQMILPNSAFEFPLDLLPVVPGLQSISGIRLTDVLNKQIYEFEDVVQIFVAE